MQGAEGNFLEAIRRHGTGLRRGVNRAWYGWIVARNVVNSCEQSSLFRPHSW